MIYTVDNPRREFTTEPNQHNTMTIPIRSNPHAFPQAPKPAAQDKSAGVVVTNIDISYFAILWIGIKVILAMPILYVMWLIVFKMLNTAIAILFTTAN